MLTLYYFPSPNGRKVSIALEEMGLAYALSPINILRGEQQAPAYLAICPNGRIPALTDTDADDGEVRLFESGAILQYLGRKSGRLYPAGAAARACVDSWLFWQMAGLGPMAGQLSWFERVSNIPDRSEADYGYPRHRYRREVERLYGVLDRRLNDRTFICDEYSIADIACWTWIDQYHNHVGGLDRYPAIAEWHAIIAAREAVRRGLYIWMPESNEEWSSRGNAAQFADARLLE